MVIAKTSTETDIEWLIINFINRRVGYCFDQLRQRGFKRGNELARRSQQTNILGLVSAMYDGP